MNPTTEADAQLVVETMPDESLAPHLPYLARFNIQVAPFAPGAGADFFYATDALNQCVDMVLHLTGYSDKTLLVSGTDGSGKSALAAQIVGRSNEQWSTCLVDGEQIEEGGELFAHILACFGSETVVGDEATLLESLQQELDEIQRTKQPVVLIDNAHLLNDEALEILGHLTTLKGDQGQLLRLTLFGDAGLSERLTTGAIGNLSAIHPIAIPAIDSAETGQYLAHRMKAAGYSEGTPFSDKELKGISAEGAGNPATINALAHEALLQQLAGGSSGGRRRIGLIALLVALLIPLLVYQLWWSRSDESPALVTAVASQPPPVTMDNSIAMANQQESEKPSMEMESQGGLKGPSSAESGPSVEATVAPQPPLIASLMPDQVVIGEGAELITLFGSGFSKDMSVAVSRQGEARLLEADEVESIEPTEVTLRFDTGKLPLQWRIELALPGGERSNVVAFSTAMAMAKESAGGVEAELSKTQQGPADKGAEVAAPAPSNITVAERKGVERSGDSPYQAPELRGRDWLLAQPKSNYTLQLIAAKQRNRVERYIRKNRLTDPVHIFTKQKGDLLLHALIWGSFATLQEARQAATTLPGRPWISKFAWVLNSAQKPPGGDTPPVSRTTVGSAWVWSRPAENYTLLLGEGSERETLIAGISPLPNAATVAVVDTERDGERRYLLLTGDFPTLLAAEDAMANLPGALRQMALPRVFATLQDAMLQYGEE